VVKATGDRGKARDRWRRFILAVQRCWRRPTRDELMLERVRSWILLRATCGGLRLDKYRRLADPRAIPKRFVDLSRVARTTGVRRDYQRYAAGWRRSLKPSGTLDATLLAERLEKWRYSGAARSYRATRTAARKRNGVSFGSLITGRLACLELDAQLCEALAKNIATPRG